MFDNGKIYVGEFQAGKKNGQGVLKIPVKDETSVAFDKFVLEVYTGNFKEDVYHG